MPHNQADTKSLLLLEHGQHQLVSLVWIILSSLAVAVLDVQVAVAVVVF
jgi:hypothetical protein